MTPEKYDGRGKSNDFMNKMHLKQLKGIKLKSHHFGFLKVAEFGLDETWPSVLKGRVECH